jgi:hypothetical protein
MLYFFRMQKATIDHLNIFKQPQRVFTTYNFPIAVVVDMINEATAHIRQQEKLFLGAVQYKAVENGSLSSTESFFAARKHIHNNKVSLIRIHFKFANDNTTKNKLLVIVYHAEAIEEQDYQPALPL